MNINKLNYELYFIDYYEGNLSQEQEAELLLFLDQNADLKEEFESFHELAALELEVPFDGKNTLKKEVISTAHIHEENAEEFLIAELEGDLSRAEQEELNAFMGKNDFYREDQKVYQQTKLRANATVFENKAALKKTAVIPLFVARMTQVAAAAAIVLFLVQLIPQGNEVYSPRKGQLAAQLLIDPATEVDKTHTYQLSGPQKMIEAKSRYIPSMTKETHLVQEQPDPIKVTPPIESIPQNILAETNTSFQKDEPIEPIAEKEALAEAIIPKVEHFKTGVDKEYVSPKEAITKFLKKKIIKDENGPIRSHIEDLELAHTVIRSVNKVFGTDIYLAPSYDDNGEMVAYAITSNDFELHRNVRPK